MNAHYNTRHTLVGGNEANMSQQWKESQNDLLGNGNY